MCMCKKTARVILMLIANMQRYDGSTSIVQYVKDGYGFDTDTNRQNYIVVAYMSLKVY